MKTVAKIALAVGLGLVAFRSDALPCAVGPEKPGYCRCAKEPGDRVGVCVGCGYNAFCEASYDCTFLPQAP